MKKLIILMFALLAVVGKIVGQSEPDYLCFEVEAGTKIAFEANSSSISYISPVFEYSFDKQSWSKLTQNGVIAENDAIIYMRGDNPFGLNKSNTHYYFYHFYISKPAKCSGNIMTLIDKIGETKVIPNAYCFNKLFYQCPIITAPELPATTLTEWCYACMFSGCKSLTTAPDLPATSLAEYCYYNMFSGCTSLITAPKLPATTLVESCYEGMFDHCRSLVSSPVLPATTLATRCYMNMFSYCSSLVSSPELSATTLAVQCYCGMFSYSGLKIPPNLPAKTLAVGCYSSMFSGSCLTTAPELPATTLAEVCYGSMFQYCKNLTTAPKLPATTLAKNCYAHMFFGCENLNNAPELPATTMAECCYHRMFSYCSSLTSAPKLPATTLAVSCYEEMFKGCTSLISAPYLPASTLIKRCYKQMFACCYKLNRIFVMFSEWNDDDEFTLTWVNQVASSGTFCCPDNLIVIYDDNHIHENWKIEPVYSITTSDKNIKVSNDYAIFGDVISLTIKDYPGYSPIVTLNDVPLSITSNTATFIMPAEDVYITVQYEKASYTISTDEYSSADKYSANYGDVITVSFAQRPGYNLSSATYNGNQLYVSDYQATFTMSTNDVSIATEYTPISFSVKPYDQYVAVDKSSATINDIVNITIADRTSENYTLTKLLVNGNEISFNGYTAQFSMSDYLSDVTIQAEYTYKDPSNTTYYTITTNEYCSVDKYSVAEGDVVTVYINQREGYSVNVYYNGEWLTSDYQASFSMPTEDVYIYAEYTEINSSQYYNVSTDQYSSTDKTQYAQGETVTVTFSKRDGYNLMSATINNTALNLNGYSATFKMPSNDVSIVAEYKKIEKPVEYTVTNTSEYVTVSTTSAKPGDEVTVFVSRRDGYTPHVFVNGAEVIINGNVAKYIQPSASVVITVDYQKDATTAVTEISGNNPAVSVYPNPARQGEKIVISIDGGIDLKNAKILIYNTHGALVKRIDHAAEYNELNLKSGIYNGVLIYKNGRQTFRIAVY